jgi:integrase
VSEKNLNKLLSSNMVKFPCWSDRNSRVIQNGGSMPEQIVQRGKRRIWYAQCRYKGVRLYECLGTTDRRLAEQRLAELKFFIERGDYKSWKKTFNDLVPEYLETILSKKSVHCQERYASIIRKHLEPYFEGVRLFNIDQMKIVGYKLHREKSKATESTLKKELRVLKDIIQLGNPSFKLPGIKDTELMRPVYRGKKVKHFLEEADLMKIIGFLDDQYKPFVMIAAYTGLRLGNVLDLIWKQVDLKAGWVKVDHTKNGEAVKIPICQKLMEVFQFLNRVRTLHDDHLFHFTPRAVQRGWKRACIKAGYDWVRFHDLRHFCGSFLANAGIEIQLIAEILGHKDLRSTRIYSHFSDSSLKQAMSVFDESDSVSKVSAN